MTEVVLASTFERYLPLIILQCLSYVNDLCSDLDINDAIILFVLAIGILQLVCLIWYTLLRLAKYLNDTYVARIYFPTISDIKIDTPSIT